MGKLIENYSLQAELGSGAYSKVYRGINTLTKQQVAVKMIKAGKVKENPLLQIGIINQINILTSIEKSPHIVIYYDMLKTSNNFYFVYEYCNGGSLEMMLKRQGKLSEKKTVYYLKQLVSAFKILSKYNIMHRDIKPQNILINNGILKLADFGCCKPLQNEHAVADTMLGSPVYMAPEVLRGEPYTMKADVWSLGVVLYRMIFGFCPFESSSIAQLINTLKTNELVIPKDAEISHGMEELIRRMLTKDSSKRIEWNEVFKYDIRDHGTVISPYMESSSAETEVSTPSINGRNQIQFGWKKSPSKSSMEDKNSLPSSYSDSPERLNLLRGKASYNPESDRSKLQSPRITKKMSLNGGSQYTCLQKSSPLPNLKSSIGKYDKYSYLSEEYSEQDSPVKSSRDGSGLFMSERFSKIKNVMKGRSKCIDVTSMALELARHSSVEALLISLQLMKIVDKDLVSMAQILKKDIRSRCSSQNFNSELHQEFISSIEQEISSLNYALLAMEGQIPEQKLRSEKSSKLNLKNLVETLKLQNLNELILMSQIVDYMGEGMLIKRSTYEKLTREQMARQIKTKISRLQVN